MGQPSWPRRSGAWRSESHRMAPPARAWFTPHGGSGHACAQVHTAWWKVGTPARRSAGPEAAADAAVALILLRVTPVDALPPLVAEDLRHK
eukprot:gene13645-biopygen15603